MNGDQPIVYLAAPPTSKVRENDKGKAKVATTDPSDADLELCPQCGKRYSRTEDVILLNPSQDEEDAMCEAMPS